MARDTEPRLVPDEHMDEEGRARLASFLTVVHGGRAAVIGTILGVYYGSDGALARAAGQLAPEDESFAAQVLRATRDVLTANVDLGVTPDDETGESMDRRAYQAARENRLGDRVRLVHLGEFAMQVSDWQDGQTSAIVPGPRHPE